MTDAFHATVTPDKPAYNDGDQAVLVLSGDDTVGGSTTEQVTISGTVKNASSGATGPFGPITVGLTKATSEVDPIVFDSLTDDHGNTWSISADGLSATATLRA